MTFQSPWSVSWILKDEKGRELDKKCSRKRLSHIAVWDIAMVSSQKRSLSSLVWDSDVFRITLLLASPVSLLCWWCFAPCCHCTYCVHSPEFLCQICFLIIWYWSFKAWIKGQLLLRPQVELITSSFVIPLYIVQLVKKPPAMQETQVWFLSQEDLLEEG